MFLEFITYTVILPLFCLFKSITLIIAGCLIIVSVSITMLFIACLYHRNRLVRRRPQRNETEVFFCEL